MSDRAIAARLKVSPSSIGAWLKEDETGEEEQHDTAEPTAAEGEVAALLLEKAKEIAELLPHGLPDKDGVPLVQQGASAVARLVEKYLALKGRPEGGPQTQPKSGEAKDIEDVLNRLIKANPAKSAGSH